MSEEQNNGNQPPVVLVEKDGNRQEHFQHPESKNVEDAHNNDATVTEKQKDVNDKRDDAVKKLPNLKKSNENALETIELSSMIKDRRTSVLPIPIPAEVYSIDSSDIDRDKASVVSEDDIFKEGSVHKQVTEQIEDKIPEWSDDEEAGGLPRSESRGSRVGRAVRQLFCCGVQYEAASEENLSTKRRHYSQAL